MTAEELKKKSKENQVLRWEGDLILEISRLSQVQTKLLKQVSSGRTHSEVVGAYMDLRNIATQIEGLANRAVSL